MLNGKSHYDQIFGFELNFNRLGLFGTGTNTILQRALTAMNYAKHVPQDSTLQHAQTVLRWGLWFCLIQFSCLVSAQELLDRIVAVVENEAITQQELMQEVLRTKMLLAQKKVAAPDDQKIVSEVLQNSSTKTCNCKKHNA